ncbi:MAG TPA: hypothetical protein VFK85_05015 [Anaeromyxobacteraceae bacterium]|nr:hypothetical protein [Anaeromyxobacteraceae bacterium]
MTALVRRIAAAATVSLATVARATGDSGTEAVGSMTVTGGQFMMMCGGLVGLGVVVWLVVKAMNR